MNTTTLSTSNKPSSSKNSMLDVASATKRLQNELMTLMMSGISGVSAFPEQDNMFSWISTIHGPEGTPYEGLVYKLSMKFTCNYPYTAPIVSFITTCFHPNVDVKTGHICLDILKEKWSAVYNVSSILLSIQSLLGEPNNNSPLNPQAAQLWENTQEFRKRVLSTHPGTEN